MGASPYKEDVSVQLCPSVRCGGKSCYGLAFACDAALSPATANSWLVLTGMGEGSLPPPPWAGLALTRQCAHLTGAVRLFCSPQCQYNYVPRCGAVRVQVMLRTRLRMRRRGTPRRRLLRLVPGSASPGWGRGVPPPAPPARPLANAEVRSFDRRRAVILFPHPHAPTHPQDR